MILTNAGLTELTLDHAPPSANISILLKIHQNCQFAKLWKKSIALKLTHMIFCLQIVIRRRKSWLWMEISSGKKKISRCSRWRIYSSYDWYLANEQRSQRRNFCHYNSRNDWIRWWIIGHVFWVFLFCFCSLPHWKDHQAYICSSLG